MFKLKNLLEDKDRYHSPVQAKVSQAEYDAMWDWWVDMNRYPTIKREIQIIIKHPETFKTWDAFHDDVMRVISKYEQVSKEKVPNNIQDILLRNIESDLEYYR